AGKPSEPRRSGRSAGQGGLCRRQREATDPI
ncbi:uncharacterized protein METZ01_LOCUS215172, partial [marine metagenome]